MSPDGYHTLTPRTMVDDVDGLVTFLRATFGATGEVTPGRPVELSIGDSTLMISGTEERPAFPMLLYVYVEDADATYARGLAHGADSVAEPTDTPWGDRRAILADRWGNQYQIAHRL